ncbi:MAG: hypothetical protein OES46_13295 [Gammaproteobacteria bacterium]|nr:hypothetical protein [Gammaproteobacteria bacterium]
MASRWAIIMGGIGIMVIAMDTTLAIPGPITTANRGTTTRITGTISADTTASDITASDITASDITASDITASDTTAIVQSATGFATPLAATASIASAVKGLAR